ncbi:MAG: PD-(D/E)XK nuclease family protein [Alphaproteobacteria bacterium]|nr:PD-(D/E)XK nuclease family protein [Alphaproteobacteria bacterium]
MNGPNLFDFAKSELSQDAFLCYLFAFGKEMYKSDFPKEYVLAHKFLAKCGIDEREEVLSVGQQVEHIDVLIITTNHILIIEDKTYTNEHDDQIIHYVKNMRQNDKKFASDKKIKVCYLKTGDYVNSYKSSDENILSNEDCCSLRRQDLIDLLNDNHENTIINMFYERLTMVDKEIKSCNEKDIHTWTKHKWFDYFYNTLKNTDKKFNIGDVPNAQGGFYACWLDWKQIGEVEKYKQIEIHFKEGKTDFVDLCLKVSSKNKDITLSHKEEITEWQKKSVQKGYIRPDCWRIGRTTTYAHKKANLLGDILDFINEK